MGRATFHFRCEKSVEPTDRETVRPRLLRKPSVLRARWKISGGQNPSDVSMPPYETSGTLSHSEKRQVESPATVTITCAPFSIRGTRAPPGGMDGCRFVRTACRVICFIRLISRSRMDRCVARNGRRKKNQREEELSSRGKDAIYFRGSSNPPGLAQVSTPIPSRHQSLI